VYSVFHKYSLTVKTSSSYFEEAAYNDCILK